MTFFLAFGRFLGGLVRLLIWVALSFLRLAFGDFRGWRGWRLRELWADQCGAVTVTFQYPVAGAVAPTLAQMAFLSLVTATITATADADTTAVVTHNMALTAAQLANGWPLVSLTRLLSFIAAAIPDWSVTVFATNSITCTKNATVGTGNAAAQVQVQIQRPHSIET